MQYKIRILSSQALKITYVPHGFVFTATRLMGVEARFVKGKLCEQMPLKAPCNTVGPRIFTPLTLAHQEVSESPKSCGISAEEVPILQSEFYRVWWGSVVVVVVVVVVSVNIEGPTSRVPGWKKVRCGGQVFWEWLLVTHRVTRILLALAIKTS